jgi:hypothetical protein
MQTSACQYNSDQDEASLNNACAIENGGDGDWVFSHFAECGVGAQAWDLTKKLSGMDIIDIAMGSRLPKEIICMKGRTIQGTYPYERPTKKGCHLYTPVECKAAHKEINIAAGCACPHKEYPYCDAINGLGGRGFCVADKNDPYNSRTPTLSSAGLCGGTGAFAPACTRDWVDPTKVAVDDTIMKKQAWVTFDVATEAACDDLRNKTEAKCSWSKHAVTNKFWSWFNVGGKDIAEDCFED